MDSTYLLTEARTQYRRVDALAVDYGQRHAKEELAAAQRIAGKLNVPLSLWQFRVEWDATLCSLSRPLGRGTDMEGVSHAFVPGRNLHLLTLAAAYARKVDASTLLIGATADDAERFPDCRPEFLDAVGAVLSLALGRSYTVRAPLVKAFKRDYLADAMPAVRELLSESWSCYTPREGAPCTDCDACVLRARAIDGQH